MTRIDHPMRSWLFTPGTRPERFAKAAEINADVLIIDLEDAVAPADKATARTAALDWLADKAGDATTVAHAVRINGLDTAFGLADLLALIAHRAVPEYVVLPKTETAGHAVILDRLLTAAGKTTLIVGIVESAQGLLAVDAIAGTTPRLAGLMLGAADMAADLGCATTWGALAGARSRVVAACAAAGIAAIDSPFFDIQNPDGCAAEARRAVDYGFVAKSAIHPSQIVSINAALTPTPEAVAKARAVLAENAKGVGTINGQMIDEAVARKARRVLAATGG
jgi:(S)-citramalyl-CoA lyase